MAERQQQSNSAAHRAASVEQQGLPCNMEAERLVLGSALLEPEAATSALAALQEGDFFLAKHRTIFTRMREMAERGVKIDRVTLANELLRSNDLDSVGGLSYLLSLDDGLPHIVNLDNYLGIVREKSILRKTIFGAQKLTDGALNGLTPGELQAAAEEILMALGEQERDTGPQTPGEIIQALPGGLQEFLGPRKQGLLSGFYKLDEMTSGFHPGQLIILAARPAMGKTAMALNIASHVAMKLGKVPMVFSLEMSKEEILHRLVCAHARVDIQKVRANYLSAEERNRLRIATNAIVEANILIDDQSGVTPVSVHARVRKQLARGPLDLVVVDYLQLMSAGRNYESKNQEVTAISRSMKLLARELRVPMLVLSQLSRAPEMRKGNNRPQLSDLRESGAIEADADLVAFIFREEVYKRDREDLRGMAELILAKQRNGPIGTVNLVFLHYLTKFENRAEDAEPPLVAQGRGKDAAAGQ